MVYIPTGREAIIDLNRCGWPKAKGWWYNCKTGEATEIGKMKTNQVKTFSTKTGGRGNDWVLVLDKAEKSFKAPGIKFNPRF